MYHFCFLFGSYTYSKKELVNVFNFHRYDNLKYATNKKDPRRHRYETKGLSIVNLLFSAASGGVSALRQHKLSGMDITLSDYDGRTALHLAASEGHLDCVEFLLEHCHVPHDQRDRRGNLAINEAETFGHHAVVKYLRKYDEDLKNSQKLDNNIINKNDEKDEQENLDINQITTKSNGIYDKSIESSPLPNDGILDDDSKSSIP